MWNRFRANKAIGLFLLFFVLVFGILITSPITPQAYAADTNMGQNSAAQQDMAAVAAMERSLYTGRYDREPITDRLNRLEETIFGEPQADQPVPERISRLKTVFAARERNNYTAATSAPTMIPGIPPKNPMAETPVEFPNANGSTAQAPPQYQQQTSESDYPTVSRMEGKVFGQAYPNEDLTKRLDRLEKKVYGHSQNGTLVERTDALRMSVLGDIGNDTIASNQGPIQGPVGQGGYYQGPPPGYYGSGQYGQNGVPPFDYGSSNQPQYGNYPSPGGGYGNDPNYPDPNGYATNSTTPSSTSPDFVAALSQVEQQVLKKTYPMEPSSARLSRLETKIFNQPAPPGMSDEDRLQRVISVAAAGGGAAPSKTAGTMRTLLPVLLMLLPLLL